MSKSRREFLTHSSLGLLGAVVASHADAQQPAELPPGAPPAFGTAPPIGPEVSSDTFAQAEKLVEVELSAAERAQAAANWRNSMAPLYERRMGPRKVAIETAVQPWSRWDPVLPGAEALPTAKRVFAQQGQCPASSVERRRHCVRSGHRSFALGETEKNHVDPADRNLSAEAGEI